MTTVGICFRDSPISILFQLVKALLNITRAELPLQKKFCAAGHIPAAFVVRADVIEVRKNIDETPKIIVNDLQETRTARVTILPPVWVEYLSQWKGRAIAYDSLGAPKGVGIPLAT